MAQDSGDPVIVNAAEALSVSRPKIVDAFKAIRSQHSGDDEPTATIDHMVWADTTEDVVKQRNPGDTDWVNLWKSGGAPVAVIPYSKTASFTVDQPGVYLVDATAGTVTATLPDAAISAGWFVMVIKTDGGGNAVSVARAGSDTIEGSASALSLASQYDKAGVFSVGTTDWLKWGGFV